MSIIQILPFISTVIMLGFTIYVFQRYFVRRAPHFLFWGIGLAMFGLGSFAEVYLSLAWSSSGIRDVVSVRCDFESSMDWSRYALFIGQAALGPHCEWHFDFSEFASAALMLSIPINDSGFHLGTPISEQYKAIIPPASFNLILIPTIIFGTVGLVLLVGGALYSAFLFWRKRVLPNRVIGNVLIAAGALSVASASELTHLGYGQYLYVGELIAVILMFVGFLTAARPQPNEA